MGIFICRYFRGFPPGTFEVPEPVLSPIVASGTVTVVNPFPQIPYCTIEE